MALTQIVNDGLGASLTATSEGGAVTTSIQQGIVKCWLNIDSSVALQDSLNVGSMTDNATGNFTTNFTNAFNNAYYTPSGQAGWNSANTNGRMVWTTHAAPTTSAHRWGCVVDTGTEEDAWVMNEMYVGDLA